MRVDSEGFLWPDDDWRCDSFDRWVPPCAQDGRLSLFVDEYITYAILDCSKPRGGSPASLNSSEVSSFMDAPDFRNQRIFYHYYNRLDCCDQCNRAFSPLKKKLRPLYSWGVYFPPEWNGERYMPDTPASFSMVCLSCANRWRQVAKKLCDWHENKRLINLLTKTIKEVGKHGKDQHKRRSA